MPDHGGLKNHYKDVDFSSDWDWKLLSREIRWSDKVLKAFLCVEIRL